MEGMSSPAVEKGGKLLDLAGIWIYLNATCFYLRICSGSLTKASGHSWPQLATVGQRAHDDKSFQSCSQMASTRLPDLCNRVTEKQRTRKRQNGKPQPSLLQWHSQLLQLPQDTNWWFLVLFLPCVSLHTPQPNPAHKTLWCRLALKGLNLVSPGRECTRWLTCEWRSSGDVSWCHVVRHMLLRRTSMLLWHLH